MVGEAIGLTTQKWNHNTILGYTDTETVKLDFDNTSFRIVRYWALRTMKWFKLTGFIILRSSEKSYHVLFNRKVSWVENITIMAWTCLVLKHSKLTGWFILQCIKKGSTLRISPKNQKPSPRIVYRYGKQDRQIEDFLLFRRQIKDIIKKMRTKKEESNDQTSIFWNK